jgi:ATP-dependent Lon protease
MDYKNDNVKKKNKFFKTTLSLYKKLTIFINHIEFLFKNKLITHDFYVEKMYILNEIQSKINNFEIFIDKKRNNKNVIDNLLNEIEDYFQKICIKTGADNCINTINIYDSFDNFIENKSNEYKDLFYLYNEYFIPLSSNKISNVDFFINKYSIKNLDLPIILPLIEGNKNNILIEKIDGATLAFVINSNLIVYINGIFKKDSLNICRTLLNFKEKVQLINEELEYLDIPIDFKEKYTEQLSLKDFLVLNPKDIADIIKNEYNDFIKIYKDRPLSLIIKEFIKSDVEKQRRIIILFLLSDSESQFTAHIIFDLIDDKNFLLNSSHLYEIIFNSLHWKIQQNFKISKDNYENSKLKLENLTINNVSYESRILLLRANDVIKSRAMEKLKEVSGSKESSIKAQLWLDGLLKIPFETFKQEPIINFFKEFQNKLEKYIDIFTIKISEFNYNNLSEKNKLTYNLIIQIIDEYHSNIYKSENSYSIFINYLYIIKLHIENKIYENNNDNNDNNDDISNNKNYNNNYFLLTDSENDGNVDNENDIIENNEVINKLSYFKKIKNDLYENNIINKNNVGIMIKKLNEIESMLSLTLLKNSPNKEDDNDESYNKIDNKLNINFKKFIMKNLSEFNNFINEWNNFKIDKINYMKKVDNILDECTYGQKEAKNQMKRIIGQWMNGTSKGQCFGLCGPPGVGKTTLCKNGLAKCLFDENGEPRPFAFIPLGGATHGSILEGSHYTYVGSSWGKIVDVLIHTKCMNPIIYIDELDKISKTEHGTEIISILTHITDQSQNKEFFDRYFTGVPIDLSQILFIFSYNDRENIDKILRDRIQEINIKPLSSEEKIIISQNYTIPEILNNVGFSINEIIFNDNIIKKIIENYTYEAGIRKLNEILYDIVREINLKKVINSELKYPIIIDDIKIDEILSDRVKLHFKKINNASQIGLVNGLYATSSGLGGLTIIQVMKTFSDKKFTLEKLTGNQGDVMKESMSCAMTLAWNILPKSVLQKINDGSENFGLHIHCPESATPKDGPSAGLAITLAIISRICGIAVKNYVAMTGEVDLLGNACEIGGLYSKLQGALNAGVKIVLIPCDNKKDLDLIFKKEKEELDNIKNNKNIKKNDVLLLEDSIENNSKIFFRNIVEIILVDNIFDVLEHGLVEHNLEFNKKF